MYPHRGNLLSEIPFFNICTDLSVPIFISSPVFLFLWCCLASADCDVVTTILNADFTSLSPDDPQFAKVTSILLDPSCSGSGLLRLEDTSASPSASSLQTRLRNLSTFQQRLLKHALSFPSVEKVVYSTCSIHAEENEYVVR